MRGLVALVVAGCSYHGAGGSGPDATASVDASAADASGDASAVDATVDAAITDAADPVTVVFQDGVNGYSGTVDTYVQSDEADLMHGTGTTIILDDDTSTGGEERGGLLRFDQVFGDGATQVPLGATIVSATLTVVVVQPTATNGTVFESAIAWDESTTWNGFGAAPGIQPPDLGTQVGPGPSSGIYVLDVAGAVSAWSADPALNLGWVFMPGGSDGCDLASSENGSAADRPTLSVTFLP